MTNSYVDLEAIRAKLRSIRDRQLIEPPTSPQKSHPSIAAFAHDQTAIPDSSRSFGLSMGPLSEPTVAPAPTPASTPRSPQSIDPVAEAVEVLQRRSLTSHSAPLPTSRPEAVEMPVVPDPVTAANQRWYQNWQRLQEQVQHINQLALAQETALLELRATAETAAHWQRIASREIHSPEAETDWTVFMRWDERQVVVPHVEQDPHGRWIICTRPVDLFRAQREAEEMAQSLRDRQHQRFLFAQHHVGSPAYPSEPPASTGWLSRLWKWLSAQTDEEERETVGPASHPPQWASSTTAPAARTTKLPMPHMIILAATLIAIAIILVYQITTIPIGTLRWIFVITGAIGLLLAFLRQQSG